MAAGNDAAHSLAAKGIKKTAVYEQIIERINALLDSGELSPGDRLPPERRLAEVFGVSRNSVREAIRVLSDSGVLESRRGSGTYVAADKGSELVDSLLDSMSRGRRHLKEIIELRQILEPHIAGMAARNGSPEDKAKLAGHLEAQRSDIRKGGSGREADLKFHNLLAAMSGNSLIMDIISRTADVLGESRSEELMSPLRREASLPSHTAILEAVQNGDADAAELAMRQHVATIAALLFPEEGEEEKAASGGQGTRPALRYADDAKEDAGEP